MPLNKRYFLNVLHALWESRWHITHGLCLAWRESRVFSFWLGVVGRGSGSRRITWNCRQRIPARPNWWNLSAVTQPSLLIHPHSERECESERERETACSWLSTHVETEAGPMGLMWYGHDPDYRVTVHTDLITTLIEIRTRVNIKTHHADGQ